MKTETRKLTDLRPNKFNEGLFPDSLSEASIQELADSIEVHGQQPILVTSDNIIIDGERRYRALKLLGREDALVQSTGKTLTDDELLDAVIQHCTAQRSISVREKVNVYLALCEKLQSHDSTEVEALGSEDRKEVAAHRAGFGSSKTANNAVKVFREADKKTQDELLSGDLSITAAWKRLEKKPRSKPKKAQEKAKAETDTKKTDEPSDVQANPFTQPEEQQAEEPTEQRLEDIPQWYRDKAIAMRDMLKAEITKLRARVAELETELTQLRAVEEPEVVEDQFDEEDLEGVN